MNARARSLLLNVARFAIPAAIITYLLWRIPESSWNLLGQQEKRWDLIGLAFVISAGATVISFIRWWLLVHCLGIQLGMVEALRLGAIGYLLSYVTPGSVGGDLFKGVFLAHRSPGKRIEALASIGVDRVIGLTGLLIVVSLALLVFQVQSTDTVFLTLRRTVLTVTPIGLCGLAGLMFGGRIVDAMLNGIRRIPLVGPGFYRVCHFVRIFHHHRGAMLGAIAMSVVVHSSLIVSVDLIARGLFESPPRFQEHLVIVPTCLAAAALPVTPAGLGVMEGAMEYMYGIIPNPPVASEGMGTLVALVYDLSRIALAMVGVVFYWTAGRDVKSSLAEAEAAAENSAESSPD